MPGSVFGVKREAPFHMTDVIVLTVGRGRRGCNNNNLLGIVVSHLRLKSQPVWPDLAKFWQKVEGLCVWQNFDPTLAFFKNFGQLFNIVNGQILKNNLANWSRCTTEFTKGQDPIFSLVFCGLNDPDLRFTFLKEIGLFQASFSLISSFQCNFNTLDSIN